MLALVSFSWYALRAARLPSSPTRTFGYHRVAILAALANAVSLVLIAGVRSRRGNRAISRAAGAGARRRNDRRGEHRNRPQRPDRLVAAQLATAGDLNIRSTYLHMLGNALLGLRCGCRRSARSIHTSIDRRFPDCVGGDRVDDPLQAQLDMLKESVCVLLEAAPAGLDMNGVEQCIRAVPRICSTRHDLHVWTLGPGAIACSCHIVVAEQSIRDGRRVLRAVAGELAERFRINHSTIRDQRWKGASRTICIAISERGEEHACGHGEHVHGS